MIDPIELDQCSGDSSRRYSSLIYFDQRTIRHLEPGATLADSIISEISNKDSDNDSE